MVIDRISVYQMRIPLRKPFVLSLERLTHAENIIIKIDTDEGITGYGECSPFKSINGESMETAWVVSDYLAGILIKRDPLDIESRILDMDRLIYGNSSIKSAFEIAMYDIASQSVNQPLYAFLGGGNNRVLQTDYTVSLGEPAQMASDAAKVRDAGFGIIKVKLGTDGRMDVERIRRIRESIGDQLPLRVDANQGWDYDTAVRTLKELDQYHIQYCEEPIPRWEFMNLRALQKASPIAIMADESVCDHHDARRLIDLDAVGFFNIKLGKSSGLSKAQKIVRMAESAGIRLQIGGFLESRLAFTASAHLALSSPQIEFIDFDTPLMFEMDPVIGGIVYDSHGMITLPEKPGLGAIPDQSFLSTLPLKIFS